MGGLKVVGAYVSRDQEWCSAQITKAITRRLRPLAVVEQICGGATVRNAETLQRGLLTRIASSIPDYWMSVQSPAATESAAVAARAALACTFNIIDRLSDSPPDRAALAYRQAFRPTGVGGGLGLKDHVLTRHASYAASVYATWSTTIKVIPALARLPRPLRRPCHPPTTRCRLCHRLPRRHCLALSRRRRVQGARHAHSPLRHRRQA